MTDARLPRVFAVLHLLSPAATRCELAKARAAGVRGVWLIDHGSAAARRAPAARGSLLRECVAAARACAACEGMWIGINAVHLLWHPDRAIALAAELGVDGVWLDQAFARAPLVQARVCGARRAFAGAVFGAVAFKGQPAVSEYQDAEPPLFGPADRRALGQEARLAARAVDVVVTSGTATGVRPSVAKVAAVVAAGVPVALSGAGLDMAAFPGVGAFFAATCLQPPCAEHGVVDQCPSSFCAFDEVRLAEFVRIGEALDAREEDDADEDDVDADVGDAEAVQSSDTTQESSPTWNEMEN